MKPWRVPYPKFGDGPGLERTVRIAAELGVDLAHFGETGAAIVGSNGKGSTAAMTAALLDTADRPVGLFTSPHLFDLNERFRIGEDDISDEELAVHWNRVVGAIDRSGLAQSIGGFEFLFLIAADWFAARKCAHTVWEAGLGGRLDPVRLMRARHVALTSLDLEHTQLLGGTLERIGLEKIEAAPPGAIVFSAVAGAESEALARWSERAGVGYVSAAPYQGDPPLPGKHQKLNAALALKLAASMTGAEEAALAPRLVRTRWPGRLEVIDDEPLTIIDVGHTPAAVAAAREGFEQLNGRRSAILVCGASRDKDAAAMIGALAAHFAVIVCAAAQHKGAPASEIAAHANAANADAEIVIAESIADARQLALARARATGAGVYVAGGLFLAAEFRAVHKGRDPASLVFF